MPNATTSPNHLYYQSIVPSNLPSVLLLKRHHLPTKSGVYIALTGDEKVLYIGSTKNLRLRWSTHNRLADIQELGCTTIAYALCQDPEMSNLERALILRLQPLLNVSHTKVSYKPLLRLEHPPAPKTNTPGFHRRLDQLRQQMGKTQEEFATYIGVSHGSMWRYCKGIQLPAGEEMRKIAQVFPGKIDWLITGREPAELETWSQLMASLSAEDQQNLLTCAKLLQHDHLGLGEVIRAVVRTTGQCLKATTPTDVSRSA